MEGEDKKSRGQRGSRGGRRSPQSSGGGTAPKIKQVAPVVASSPVMEAEKSNEEKRREQIEKAVAAEFDDFAQNDLGRNLQRWSNGKDISAEEIEGLRKKFLQNREKIIVEMVMSNMSDLRKGIAKFDIESIKNKAHIQIWGKMLDFSREKQNSETDSKRITHPFSPDEIFWRRSRKAMIKELAAEIKRISWLDENKIKNPEVVKSIPEIDLDLRAATIRGILKKEHKGIEPETKEADERMTELHEMWAEKWLEELERQKYGKEVTPASKSVPVARETTSPAEFAPATPEPGESMQTAKDFTSEQSKVLLRLIAVASNLFKVWSGESEQQKPEIGDDETRKKIVLDRIRVMISDLINKDPITKKIFTEEKIPEAIDHVMKFAEKFNSKKKDVEVTGMVIDITEQPPIDDKEELIRKKSAGSGRERKDTGLKQLYESLAQKARLAEIEDVIRKKPIKRSEEFWDKMKVSFKQVNICLNRIVRDFDKGEVETIRDYFLGDFMNIYIKAREKKVREKKGKELNAKESVELKKEEFGKIEKNLLDRYKDNLDHYEDKIENIMNYFWQMSNLEMFLDK